MDKKEQKSFREQIITREFKKNIEIKTMLDFELALQKSLDPKEKAMKIPLRYADNGTPISWETIERGKYVDRIEANIEDVVLKLKILEELK